MSIDIIHHRVKFDKRRMLGIMESVFITSVTGKLILMRAITRQPVLRVNLLLIRYVLHSHPWEASTDMSTAYV